MNTNQKIIKPLKTRDFNHIRRGWGVKIITTDHSWGKQAGEDM